MEKNCRINNILKELTKLEESFSKFITEIENTTTEFKKDIKNLFLDNVKEIEVFSTKLGKVFITDLKFYFFISKYALNF